MATVPVCDVGVPLGVPAQLGIYKKPSVALVAKEPAQTKLPENLEERVEVKFKTQLPVKARLSVAQALLVA